MRGLPYVVTFTLIATATLTTAAPIAAATPHVQVVPVCSGPPRPGFMECMALRRTDVPPVPAGPHANPPGYRPADLRAAYGLPVPITTTRVAIVDAYDDPNAESDLAVYRDQYGLPPCTTANGCFRKVNQFGEADSLPDPNKTWAGEISLDLDMVSAICGSCRILLVEARSNSDANLFAAIARAAKIGIKYISNSWGGPEFSGETSYDTSALDQPGVAITASTGDNGTGAAFPAASRFVTAVGGTSLKRATNSRGWTETAWHGAGSGCSAYEARPVWQTEDTACKRRAEADVSAVADPSTGVSVYQTYGGAGWLIYGGTSVAAPIIATVYAIAGRPGPPDYPATYPYTNLPLLHDVTVGNDGSCTTQICRAGVGWDGPTGLGTPFGKFAFKGPVPPPGGPASY